jgi:N-acyl-D-aspartate/D-glutamate deacylase
VSSIAASQGRSVPEVAYDLMAKDGFVFAPMLNYHDGNLGAAFEMMTHPHCLLAASDAGAHSLTICDGALSTFMLTHWGRDRSRGKRLPIERIVSLLTAKPADEVGLKGRGRIALGAVADINVIDLAKLRVKQPQVVNDLTAGGERLLQGAAGYRATIVGGQITRDNDRDTGVRPGRLLRRGADTR